jgi:hypothetical protein
MRIIAAFTIALFALGFVACGSDAGEGGNGGGSGGSGGGSGGTAGTKPVRLPRGRRSE